MTIVERKLKFHDLFGSMGKMTVEDDLFKDDKFINKFKEAFGGYAADVHVEELDVLSSNIMAYFTAYETLDRITTVHFEDSITSAVKMVGASVICLSYFGRESAYSYLIENLTPLYDRLPKTESIDNFIFVNVAKHMMGEPTDVSETVYAYFLEAEKL